MQVQHQLPSPLRSLAVLCSCLIVMLAVIGPAAVMARDMVASDACSDPDSSTCTETAAAANASEPAIDPFLHQPCFTSAPAADAQPKRAYIPPCMYFWCSCISIPRVPAAL